MTTTRVFPSAKNFWIGLVFGGTFLLLTGLTVWEFYTTEISTGQIIRSVLTLAVQGLLLWFWFETKYAIIEGSTLRYRSGPLHGEIDIQSITRVKLKERLWSGLRPALGLHGLVVYYNKWDEIYLSPAQKQEFVKALQEVNPSIVVTE
jgi:hypothetical protein